MMDCMPDITLDCTRRVRFATIPQNGWFEAADDIFVKLSTNEAWKVSSSEITKIVAFGPDTRVYPRKATIRITEAQPK